MGTSQRDRIPKREHRLLIRKTKELIRGRRFTISLPKLGVRAEGKLCWEQDRSPDIDVVSYKALPNTPPYFQRLVRKLEEWDLTCLHEDVCQEVLKSKPFRQMQKDILAVCRESDALEARDPEFDWVKDILDFAESLGGNPAGSGRRPESGCG